MEKIVNTIIRFLLLGYIGNILGIEVPANMWQNGYPFLAVITTMFVTLYILSCLKDIAEDWSDND